MFPFLAFAIDWSLFLDRIVLAGSSLYDAFCLVGYWFASPLHAVFGDPSSPLYSELWLSTSLAISSLEFAANKLSDGLYSGILTFLLGVNSITGISLLTVISCNIVLLVVLRFVKWLWDVIPFV